MSGLSRCQHNTPGILLALRHIPGEQAANGLDSNMPAVGTTGHEWCKLKHIPREQATNGAIFNGRAVRTTGHKWRECNVLVVETIGCEWRYFRRDVPLTQHGITRSQPIRYLGTTGQNSA